MRQAHEVDWKRMAGDSSILLLGGGETSLPEFLQGTVASRGCILKNVYLALARVGKDPSIRTVVADLDFVSSDEMDFFSLVGCLRRDVSVYVTGSASDPPRFEEAIARGATGRLTDSAARMIVARITEDDSLCADSKEDVSARPSEEELPTPDATVRQIDVPLEEPSDSQREPVIGEPDDEENEEGDNPTPESKEEPSEPIRVPWLRYQDAPGRKAPQRSRRVPPRQPPARDKPNTGPPESTDDSGDEPVEHKPLLTDEELAALLGDSEPFRPSEDSVENPGPRDDNGGNGS